jgi:hypothetical protein
MLPYLAIIGAVNDRDVPVTILSLDENADSALGHRDRLVFITF